MGPDATEPVRGGDVDRVAVLVELAAEESAPEAARARALTVEREVETFSLDPAFGHVDVPARPDAEPAALRAPAAAEPPRKRVRVVRGTVSRAEIEVLREQPGVVAVYEDSPIAPFRASAAGVRPRPEAALMAGCDCETTTAKGELGQVAAFLDVPAVWAEGYRGAGITIGIVDGGVTARGRERGGEPPGLTHVTGGWPERDWGTSTSAWKAHGNMTATDALAMAPEAEIFDIRISDGGMTSTALLAYRWAIDTYRASGRPQILSNSWGIYTEATDPAYAHDPGHPLTRVVVEAMDAGIIVVFAAGNCGERCPSRRCASDVGPGRSIWAANGHPRVVSVGAANTRGEWIGYSSQGPSSLGADKPDICAVSHFRGYERVDTGTSAACPLVAGILALLRQADTRLDQDTARAALRDSASRRDSSPNGAWGAGIVQAHKALERLLPLSPAPSPRWDRWCPVGDALCLYGAAAAAVPGGIEILTVGTDSRLYHRGFKDGQWRDLGIVCLGRPSLLAGSGGSVHAFAIGEDRAAWMRTRSPAGWSDWERIGGTCLYGLAAAASDTGELSLLAIGLDSRMYVSTRTGGEWLPWRCLGGTCLGPPAAAVQADELLALAIGPDLAMYTRAVAPADDTWQRVGGQWLHGPAAACNDGLELFAIGLDGVLRSVRQQGDAWSQPANIGGVCLSAPAAVVLDGGLWVFVIGERGALWQRTRRRGD